ncbi:hypothetical protein D3C77_227840 [compost metagenome]
MCPVLVANQAPVPVAIHVSPFVTAAYRQQGIGCQVGFQGAEHHMLLAVGIVVEVLLVFKRHGHPTAQGTVKAQGAGHIHFAAVVVPAARRLADFQLVVGQCTFAHQVDAATGIAGAAVQAIGAAQHLDVIVGGHVGQGVEGLVAQHRRTAVSLDAANDKTTGVDFVLRVVAAHYGNACGLVEHLGEAGQVLVFHALLAHDRNRLGCFTQTPRRLATCADGPGGVGAGVLGEFAEGGGPDDAGGGQRHGASGVRGGRYQSKATIAHGQCLQATAGQQAVKGLVDGQASMQSPAVLASQIDGLEGDVQAGLAAEFGECKIQRSSRNGELMGGAGADRISRLSDRYGAQAKAETEEGMANGDAKGGVVSHDDSHWQMGTDLYAVPDRKPLHGSRTFLSACAKR